MIVIIISKLDRDTS